MKTTNLLTVILLTATVALGQGVAINETGAEPDPSAMLDVTSTSKGLLVPRMTIAQRNAIVLPKPGLLIFQTDATPGFYYNANTASSPSWQRLGDGSAGQWTVSGDNVYYNAGNVGIGTPSPSALLHTNGMGTGGGNVLFSGEFNAPLQGDPPTSGAGTRMMWYPNKAAFRAGQVSGDHWNKDNVGNHSMALGYNVTAFGYYSIAMGSGSIALGPNSLSIGANTNASGQSSVALGSGTTASNTYSTAMGCWTTASGTYSTAMGYNTIASGENATAMGNGAYATGYLSTAMGNATTASSMYSTAMGSWTTASGAISTAIGSSTIAASYTETVIGRLNTEYTPNSVSDWNSADRLFVIGNGTSAANRSNALTMLKNGNTGFGVDIPTQKLDIDGQVRIRGGAPGNGKVLTSDANGVGSWQTPNWSKWYESGQDIYRLAGNIAIGTHLPGTNRLRVISSGSGGGSATGYFENTNASGLAFRAATNSSDGTALLIQQGTGYSLRCDGYDPGWFVAMIVKGRKVGINTENPGDWNLAVNGSAAKTGGGSWSTLSDARLKTINGNYSKGLNEIIALQPVLFNYIAGNPYGYDSDMEQIGFVAQEVQKIFPEAVSTGSDGYLDFNIHAINVALINAVKEQQALIELLMQRIENLEEER